MSKCEVKPKVIEKTISVVNTHNNSLELHCLRCDKLFEPKDEHDRYCLTCSNMLTEIWNETKEMDELKRQIEKLTKKVAQRVDELGEVDIMSYREDPVIKELLRNICKLYREGIHECEHFDESKVPTCKFLRNEPAMVKRLELSEERICPLLPKKDRS